MPKVIATIQRMQSLDGQLCWVIDLTSGDPQFRPDFILFESYGFPVKTNPNEQMPAKLIPQELFMYTRQGEYPLAESQQLVPMVCPVTANVRLLPLVMGCVRLAVRLPLVDPQFKSVKGPILRIFVQVEGTLQIDSSYRFKLEIPRENGIRFEDDD